MSMQTVVSAIAVSNSVTDLPSAVAADSTIVAVNTGHETVWISDANSPSFGGDNSYPLAPGQTSPLFNVTGTDNDGHGRIFGISEASEADGDAPTVCVFTTNLS